jgi:hypothetical protein
MTRAIETIAKPREILISLLKDLSTEQLNKIPAGFNNNIIWNLGHMIAAQQGLCYKRAGLDAVVDDNFFNQYKSGTKPERFIDASEIENVNELLFSTLEQLEKDLANTLFGNYTPLTTRYGVEVANIEQAINFLPFHEGLHIGAIMALKRLVA